MSFLKLFWRARATADRETRIVVELRSTVEIFSAELDRLAKAAPGDYRSSEDPIAALERMKALVAYYRHNLARAHLTLALAKGWSEKACKRLEWLRDLYEEQSVCIAYLNAYDAAVRRGDEKTLAYNDFDPEKIRSSLERIEDSIARCETDLAPILRALAPHG